MSGKSSLFLKQRRKEAFDWRDTLAARVLKRALYLRDRTTGGLAQVVPFLLNGREYAVELKDAFEVVRPGRITRVPRTPDFIAGIQHVRGEMIAVMDLKRRLGLSPEGGAARLLIAGKKGLRVGLLVDRLAWIKGAREEVFERLAAEGPFFQGRIRLNERVIAVLDLERLLDFSITPVRARR